MADQKTNAINWELERRDNGMDWDALFSSEVPGVNETHREYCRAAFPFATLNGCPRSVCQQCGSTIFFGNGNELTCEYCGFVYCD